MRVRLLTCRAVAPSSSSWRGAVGAAPSHSPEEAMTSQIGSVKAEQPGVRQAGPAAWQATSAVRAGSQRMLERVVPRRTLRALKRLAASAAVILSVVTVTFLVTRVFAPDPTSL